MPAKNLEKLPPELFDWQLWRAGNPGDLMLECRTSELVANRGRRILMEHAIGYCDASRLSCRAKEDHVALMVFKNGIHFWFHLRLEEFKIIFGGMV